MFMLNIFFFDLIDIKKELMKFIDLRSDGVTEPLSEMMQAMMTASYGDQSYGQDKNLLKLESEVAQLLGKQAASFVPSGKFGNQCAIMAHTHPGQQIILPKDSHAFTYENGGIGMLAKVLTRTVECDSDMLMKVDKLKHCLQKQQDYKSIKVSLFEIENPTSVGRVYPTDHFHQLIQLAKQANLSVHMDGARMFNACAFLKVQPRDLVAGADSVMFCLSKALCLPFGSMVVGSKDFIARFNNCKRMMGGMMRKIGMFAQMGLIALAKVRFQLYKDHDIARTLAHQMESFHWIQISKLSDINMIFFKFTNQKINPLQLQSFLKQQGIKVIFSPDIKKQNRFVTHHYIRQSEIEKIVQALSIYQKQVIS